MKEQLSQVAKFQKAFGQNIESSPKLIQEDNLLSTHELIDSIENYKNFLLEDTKVEIIKEKTRTGKPCGDEKFYDKIESMIGIDYRKKKPGPKISEN